MKLFRQILFAIVFIFSIKSYAQKGFCFEKSNKTHVKVPFKLIGNLIVLDVKLNEISMSFILDTGANHTFLFNMSDQDTLKLNNMKKTPIRGLGSTKSVESIKSSKNKLEIKGIIDEGHDIYLILDQEINFSTQLGVPINGIIGCDILQNFITKINYNNKTITFYKPEEYKRNQLKKYKSINFFRYKRRVFVDVEAALENEKTFPVTLLLDTGSSDGIWLFENAIENIKVPEKKFRDYMGAGIGGEIHGYRSRLNKLKIDDYEFSNAKVAFPDSTDIALAYLNKNRQGSLGSGILKRFNLIFDYNSSKMYLKKNKFFKKPFEYNMSGIEIEHNGVRVEKVFDGKLNFSDQAKETINAKKAYSINSLFKTSLVPVFEIVEVRKGSLAEVAGVKKGDVLIRVNKKETYRHQLSEIIEMLSAGENEKIILEVERNGKKMKFGFKLKRLL